VGPQLHVTGIQLTTQSTHSFRRELWRGNQGFVWKRLRRNQGLVWKRRGRNEGFLGHQRRCESVFLMR
jgi:hypothetical protein